MVAPRFHDLTIKSAIAETADAVVLSFDIPDALRALYAFVPGQYLTLRDTIDQQDVRRSYSICSAYGAQTLSVGIKHVEDGVFSTHAMTLKAGDTLAVMTPQGRFTAPIGGVHDYLLLAAGSGITPMVSIARSVLENEPDSTVTLCYANRTTDSIMFRTLFADLKDRFMNRFSLTHVLDEELQDVELFNGRLDADKLTEMAGHGLISPTKYSAVYICGPEPMIKGASGALEALGVDKENIKFELFTPAGGASVARQAAKSKQDTGDSAIISVIVDGSTRSFPLAPGETAVAAAEKAGVEFPYSCNNGMCATCRCKLVTGQADMAQNFSLEEWEMKAGFILACQLQPNSDRILLDFDEI